MSPEQVQQVQQSYARLSPMADQVAELFYARLFELDPSLRKLFRGDIKRQGMMLMSMIGAAVRGLSDANALIPVLTALGRRHTGYGVVEAHYVTVGQALVWTLEKGLGAAFTAEMRNAWVAAYTLMATVMKQGAGEVQLGDAVAA
jgi:hemoglobin-like flavoprotein